MNFTNSFHKEFYDFYEHTIKADMKKELLFICYVVVSLLIDKNGELKALGKGLEASEEQEYVDAFERA